jgi:HlyD family secretion protein
MGPPVKATGTLQSEVIADVNCAVRGKIQKLLSASDWGAAVKKGDVLAEIDPATFKADVELARAGVAEAEAGTLLAKAQSVQVERDLERAKKLMGTGGITQTEFDMYKAAAEVANAKLAVANAKVARSKAAQARAQLDLDACTIRSPIDGVIIDRRVNAGQIVNDNASAPSLFLIAGDLKKLEVWAMVKESDVTRMAKGRPATFTVAAFPKDNFKGRVTQTRLNATFAKDQVYYTVVIEVDNRDGRLLPYMTAEVTIEAEQR